MRGEETVDDTEKGERKYMYMRWMSRAQNEKHIQLYGS